MKEKIILLLAILLFSSVFSQETINKKRETEVLINILKESHESKSDLNKGVLQEAFENEKNLIKYPELFFYKGVDFFNNSNFALAKKYLTLAKKHSSSPKHNNLLASTTRYLGSIYAELSEPIKAKKYYTESLNLYKKLGDHDKIRELERSIIYLEFYKGNREKSLKELDIYLKDTEKYSISNQANDICISLMLHTDSDKLNQCKKMITEEKKNILLKGASKRITGLYFLTITDYYLKNNDIETSLKYMDTASVYLKKSKIPYYKESLFKKYAELYKKKGDLIKYSIYNDSLIILEKELKNNIQSSTINELKDEQDYNILIRQLKYHKNIQIVIIILSFLFFSVTLYFLLRKFSFFKKNNHLLVNKNKFITENYEKLLSTYTISNEKLKIIQNQLKETNKDEDLKKINSIYKELNVFLSNTDNVSYLNKIQDDFFFILKQDFPNLTDIELHVCFLLKLNLKTNDISITLNRTKRSIENIKFRIRKKIKEKTTKSLEEILENISIKEEEVVENKQQILNNKN